MENAILYAGVEELNTIKEHVMEYNGYQDRNLELKKEEQRLGKLLAGKEKDLSDETETTLKKRKNEIVASYEGQIANLNARNKKVKAKKDKAKGMKVSERISEETSELREENMALATEIKAKRKADKMPRFCDTTLFYGMFLPKSLLEFVVFLAAMLLVFLALPFGVYYVFFAERFGELALAFIYLITILVFGGLYLLLNNKIKERHLETMREIRGLRHQYRKNQRSIRKIQKGIKKDSDESTYGLEQYDDELMEIESEIRRIAEEEKDAVNTFEGTTSVQIREEIKGRYQAELDSLRKKYEETCADQKKAEEKVKEYTLLLSRQYEAYLGKEMMTVEKLDRLIGRIEKGEASNIGEALALEKNK